MLVDQDPPGILDTARVNYCRTCGARIRWALTLESRRMPFDADPNTDGNLAVFAGAAHGGLLCRVITAAEPLRDHEVQCMPHFATCKGRRPARPATPTTLPDGVVSLHARRTRKQLRR